ncbi:F-box domain-containing protein [Hirschfeldia incana]|nr:F-box domain-containing protein [Hirschfeldia incana]
MARDSPSVITIPLDLIVEILEKLPTKSLARFRCVSYQWESIINSYIVIDSIVTRRSNQQPPRDPHFFLEKLLNQPQRGVHWRSFPKPSSILSYTYLYHQVTDEEQLYHEEIVGKCEGYLTSFQYVRGLIGFSCSSRNNAQFRIHNPTTRQSIFLPVTRLPGTLSYLFGYDPFKNQYKVLCLTSLNRRGQSSKLFILGDVSNEWWDIPCSIGSHSPFGEAVVIDGTIYYTARNTDWTDDFLVSFDVRHEMFNHIQTPEDLPLSTHRGDSTLVNYNGKLGCMCPNNFSLNTIDVDVWVMQDAEKQEWSKVTFSDMLQGLPKFDIRFAGVTNPGGEIVIVRNDYLSEFALDVYYYDPKHNGLRRAEIQTTTSLYRVRPSEKVIVIAVTDHVENIIRL